MKNKITEGTIVTTAELSKLFKVSRSQITLLVRKGLPAQRIGRDFRFYLPDAEKWYFEQQANF